MSERICAISSHIVYINPDCWRVIYGDLHSRVPDGDVSTNDVSMYCTAQTDPVSIPARDIFLDNVVTRENTYAEVTPEGGTLISVSHKPVPTEPVASANTRPGQSYAATATARRPVSYGNVVVKLVAGARTYENTGQAVSGCDHIHHPNAGSGDEMNARGPKLLDQAGSVNGDARLGVNLDSGLVSDWAGTTGRSGIRLPRHAEAVQLQRYIRRPDGDAWGAGDSASDVVHELTVLSDGQCSGNGPADICGVGASGAQEERDD
jgi:hypothetical protein